MTTTPRPDLAFPIPSVHRSCGRHFFHRKAHRPSRICSRLQSITDDRRTQGDRQVGIRGGLTEAETANAYYREVAAASGLLDLFSGQEVRLSDTLQAGFGSGRR
jgi:hypothetical protein